MSDEIAILRDGRLIQRGTPAVLYEKPMSRFVAGFLGRSNFLHGTVESMSDKTFMYRCGGSSLHQTRMGESVTLGRSVLISLRPEKIRILADGAAKSSGNRLVGHVSAFNYLGGVYHLHVEVETVGRIMVDTATWRQAAPMVGQEIEFGWDEDASVPVSED
jgi:ABC-type Fe3+/spermidine/putrescine transport system ATPase subunit